MIVLDTNVLSALMRPASNEPVVEWVDRQQASLLWTTSVSLMEIRTGLLLLPEGARAG
jgi:toxin FitB